MSEPIPHEVGAEHECEHALVHLSEYLDSEMTDADEQRMRDHLAHCAPCLAELGAEELVKRIVRRSCADRAPEALRQRIQLQLQGLTIS